MAKIGRLLFCLFLLIGMGLGAEETVKVEALVDRNEVGQGDTLILTVRASSSSVMSAVEPNLPNLPGFDLEGTMTRQSTRSTFENGKFLSIQSIETLYSLRATQKGTLTIGAVEVNIGGTIFRTRPIKITVNESGRARPSPGVGQGGPGGGLGDPFAGDDFEDDLMNMLLRNRNLLPPSMRQDPAPNLGARDVNPEDAFFVDVEVSKNRVYKGEGVQVSYYLYTRANILELDTLKHPELQGFLREDVEIPQRLSFSPVVVNGLEYNRALLAAYIVFPLKEGKLKIDEYKTRCKVLLGGRLGFGRTHQATKSNKPVSVEVLPLPSASQPREFSGAVGNFEVAAKLERPTIPVQQPVSYKIRFDGTSGNAKLIELPRLELPPSVEVYDSKSDAKFFANGKSYKEFSVLLIPREVGAITIPQMQIAVFNPTTEKYEQRIIPTQQLQVSEDATGTTSPQTFLAKTPEKSEKVGAEEPSLRLPGLVQGYVAGNSLNESQTVAMWAVLYLFILLLLTWRSRLVLGWGEKRITIAFDIKRRVKKIEVAAQRGDFRRVGADLTNLIYFTLGALSEHGSGSRDSATLLQACPPSVRREYGTALEELMATTQTIGLAPEAMVGDYKTPSALKKHVKQARSLLLQAVAVSRSGARDNVAKAGPITS